MYTMHGVTDENVVTKRYVKVKQSVSLLSVRILDYSNIQNGFNERK